MNNKFDEKISKMLNEDVYIPQKITNTIKSSLKEKKKGMWLNMKFSKMVATTLGVVIIGTGVVFAGKAIIDKRKSTEIAKENNYFEKMDTEFVFHNDLGIRIENYFIDNGRVGITFDIKSNELLENIDLYNTTLNKDNTWSETVPTANGGSNTTIHWDESKEGIEYRKRWEIIKFYDEEGNRLKFDEDSIGGRGPAIENYEKLDNNVLRFLYTSPIYESVTESKMKITIKRVTADVDGVQKEYLGNWEFEIDVADRFLKSNTIKYNGTTNLENVSVESAEIGATKLIVTVKTDNLHKLLYGSDDNKSPLYGGATLVGAEGAYNGADINDEQKSYYSENKMTFIYDISKFSAESSYKIVLESNTEANEDLIITLTK